MPYEPLNFPRKDPQAKIAYALDWSDWLLEDETIQTLTVTVTGADKLGSESIVGSETRVTLGGGTPGTIATVLFHIVTNTGLEDERTAKLEIVER